MASSIYHRYNHYCYAIDAFTNRPPWDKGVSGNGISTDHFFNTCYKYLGLDIYDFCSVTQQDIHWG